VSTSLDEFMEGPDKPKLTVEYVARISGEGRRVRMDGRVVGVLVDTPRQTLYNQAQPRREV
jgi:hypothetical protein